MVESASEEGNERCRSSQGVTSYYMETTMAISRTPIERALAAIDPESKTVARVTAKSFVKNACLIAPELPLGFTGMLVVTLNGRRVAVYPGTIRKFPGRNLRG